MNLVPDSLGLFNLQYVISSTGTCTPFGCSNNNLPNSNSFTSFAAKIVISSIDVHMEPMFTEQTRFHEYCKWSLHLRRKRFPFQFASSSLSLANTIHQHSTLRMCGQMKILSMTLTFASLILAFCQAAAAVTGGGMTVYVKSMENPCKTAVEVACDSTAGDLRRAAEQVLDQRDLRLMVDGKIYPDEGAFLSDLAISAEAVAEFTVPPTIRVHVRDDTERFRWTFKMTTFPLPTLREFVTKLKLMISDRLPRMGEHVHTWDIDLVPRRRMTDDPDQKRWMRDGLNHFGIYSPVSEEFVQDYLLSHQEPPKGHRHDQEEEWIFWVEYPGLSHLWP